MPLSFCAETALSPRFAEMLWNRGFETPGMIERYLNPRLKYLMHPDFFPEMRKASALLAEKLVAGEKVAVWGDYDVDGITASVIVLQTMEHYGFHPLCHLPERRCEGYGLNEDGVDKLFKEGATVLVTVDCGISDKKAIDHAKRLGMTVIVTDHHMPPPELPEADMICNPKLTEGPGKALAGVGVAFFLMAGLNIELAKCSACNKFDIRDLLDLTALGTLADMVPLDEQNRIIVKNGLLKLAEGKRAGIAALKSISGIVQGSSITSEQVAFKLAPRVNAAGRMSEPKIALELFRTADRGIADELARELDRFNALRKQEEERIAEEAAYHAVQQINDAALVITGENWNQGVIGIVASRMIEKWHKPTIILCRDGDTYKGSGRSVEGFNLYEALKECSDTLASFGGHPMAAGVRVEPQYLDSFAKRFKKTAHEIMQKNPPPQLIYTDGVLGLQEALNWDFIRELDGMQPFGPENPEPVFESPALLVKGRTVFGYGGTHVKLWLLDEQSGVSTYVKCWRRSEEFPEDLPGKRIVMAYTPFREEYEGMPSISIRLHRWAYAPESIL